MVWMGSFGEGQQDWFVQVGDGIVFDVQVIFVQVGMQQMGQVEEGFFVVDYVFVVGFVGDVEFFVVEEGEVVVQQLFEIVVYFFQFFCWYFQFGFVKLGQQFVGFGFYWFEVGDGYVYFIEYFQDGFFQCLQFVGVGVMVDFQVYQ